MRIIGTLFHENQARRFSNYLTNQGISNLCEVNFNALNGQMTYEIWIREEDKIQEAASILAEFENNPSDRKFDAPIPEPEPVPLNDDHVLGAPAPLHQFKTYLTQFLIAVCALVFFFNTLQEIPLKNAGLSEQSFFITPLQAQFMYDLPPPFEELEKIIEKYELRGEKKDDVSLELKAEIASVVQTPYWKGIYSWVVAKINGSDTSSGEGPLFIQIRKGEFWRLITPCLLHQDLLHIIFNMLWLWYLGRPIEQRIGPTRMLLLSLIAGVGSNTMQYLMSGPFFIGYSGIVTALAGFTWMRERIAPWEGYPLNRATILFLVLFIGAVFVLQAASFFIQIFSDQDFAPNIANTAHIAGAIIGAYLGKFKFFAQRVKL
jgi:GlpG protein